ncbi:alpha/beta fold hydrolase [Nonomuraea terrae]|uniref:Alpha/beta fold hydrolase n=1 Tax=Nonomuraea terrae TaxID=2530383 RepID=A0A4R4YN33_9ACTN|nr:alpha/beta fold hydrolase [Nonomuraea terrae]TDD46441.1 alpha/beta fold hydrolase [Nonomuraea terrae]
MILRAVLAVALSVPPVTAPPLTTPDGTGPSACPVAVPSRTTCGFLEVPERRDAPGRTIRVGYAVREAPVAGRRPDPVVFMGGGPGAASMPLMGVLSRMFPDRDVIAVEQRGGRHSRPSLGCPEIAQALLGRLRRSPADVADAARRCRARLAEPGVDLRGYATGEIAADVVALRGKLGYASWNLFGVGYSTRVMAQAAAADPEGVRSVVLDSFMPAGTGDAGRALADALARMGVRERFEAVTARLNRSPAAVPATDPLLGRAFTARMSGDDVAAVLAQALRGGEAAAVPAVLDALAEGREEPLGPLADAVGEELMARELGLYHAVRCQDGAPGDISRLFTEKTEKAVCDAWRLPASAPVRVAPEAPVYVLGGRYDPIGPPATARQAAEALPRGRFQEFPGLAHAVFEASACARREIAAFVRDPAGHPVTPCPEVRPLGELHVTAAPYRISRAPWLAAPLAVFALASLAQLAAGALKGRATTAYAGLAGVAFTGLAVQSAAGLAAESATAAAVGVPAVVGAYTWLAGVSGVLTAATLLQRRAWPQIMTCAISGAFLVWWFTWFL